MVNDTRTQETLSSGNKTRNEKQPASPLQRAVDLPEAPLLPVGVQLEAEIEEAEDKLVR